VTRQSGQPQPQSEQPQSEQPQSEQPQSGQPQLQSEQLQREQLQSEQRQSYEEAAARVEEIIRRLDSGEASLGETLELVREGKTLIEQCAGELDAVAGALEELRLDELVERLESQARRPGVSPAGHAGLGSPAASSKGGTGG
jgi:exodeoxyribonuclease VII small subunit